MAYIASNEIPLGLPSTRQTVGIPGASGRQPTIGLKRTFFPVINPSGHFYSSVNNMERVPLVNLRNFSRIVPAQRAMNRIVDGILAMSWSILPPQHLKEDPKALDTSKKIEGAFRRPNRDEHNTYSKIVTALVNELCILGVAAVERQPGNLDTQPFWMWDANAGNIHMNPLWTPQKSGLVPRYYDMTPTAEGNAGIPIMDEEMFLIQKRTNTWEFVPPSPLETAYGVISAWLGVSEYQQMTTSRATQEYILDLGDVSEDQLASFKEYWETDVQGKGKTPIIAGKGQMKTEKIGASDDQGLYHEYTQYLLKIIAFCFGLNPRDFNLTEHDNRATAGAAADSSYAEAILPMAITIAEHFDIEIVGHYYPGYRFKLNDTEPRTEEQEVTMATTLYEKGVITKNEARRRVKEDEVPDGDKFMDASTKTGPSDKDQMQQSLDQQKLDQGGLSMEEKKMQVEDQKLLRQQGANKGFFNMAASAANQPNGKAAPHIERQKNKRRDFSGELEQLDIFDL